MAGDDNGYLKTIIGSTILIVTCFGLFLNLTGIYTLRSGPKSNKLFNNMVICLLIFDTWYLITSPFFFFGLQHEHFKWNALAYINVYWGNPCGHMAVFGTISMTLAISHERYLAIKKPLIHNRNNLEFDQKKRLLLYFIPCLLMSIFFNIPRFFNFDIVVNNATVDDYSISTKLSASACCKMYKFYYEFIFNSIIFGIIPILLLIFLSYQTFVKLKEHNIQRIAVAANNKEDVNRASQQQEGNMAKVMFGLSSLFLICHLPRILFMAFVGITGKHHDRCEKQEPGWPMDTFGIFVYLAVFLVMVNSSIGTLTYCAMNYEFRQHLLKLLKSCYTPCKRK